MTSIFLVTGATGLIGFRVLLDTLKAGNRVRFTARSEQRARTVTTNPAILKLDASTRDRLSLAVVTDYTVPGAWDAALQGVTHVVHVGSPVPAERYDPKTEVFLPTVEGVEVLLNAALNVPSVRRVLITSSIVSNMSPIPDPSVTVTASSRVPSPSPVPESFTDVFEAYILGKIVEINATDAWIESHKPHFAISHVIPGYVFGRNELCLNTEMMASSNSSNNFIVLNLLGGELPFPIHGAVAHIDDVAEAHLRVAAFDASTHKDFGIATVINYDQVNDYIEKAFPDQVKQGLFKRGKIPTLPVSYDSSETETVLGVKLKPFERAVIDVADQYLELLAKEKA